MKIYISLVIAIFVSTSTPLSADTPDFPSSYTYSGLSLHRQGVAELKFKRVIPAYAGAFYLQDSVTPKQALQKNVARKLELHYYHNIKAEDFADATEEMVKRNVSAEEYRRISAGLAEFVALYRNVQKNDRYALVYLPGEGTALKYNGITLGKVRGERLSQALFSIWIGDNPIDKGFKQDILGLSR